jgi:hypothetical protein
LAFQFTAGKNGGLGTIAQIQPMQNTRHMIFDRFLGNTKTLDNFSVFCALGNPSQNLLVMGEKL